MRRSLVVVACVVAAAAASAQQGGNALQNAAASLGVANIDTIEFSGSGRNFSVGQNYTAAEPWPAITVTSYTAQINFQTASMRQELVRDQPNPTMPRGGGAPFMGQQRQIQVVSGDFAWNVPPPPPPAPVVTPEPGRVTAEQAMLLIGTRPPGPPPPQAAAANQVDRMLWLWSATPHGFLKAAQANNATARAGRNNTTEVSFMLGGKHRMTGTLNAQGQVDRVQTTVYNPIVGDMVVETRYSNYRDFGGVTFPANIVQLQDGFPALELTITSVKVNPAVALTVPDVVRTASAAAPPAITVTSQELAKGVYLLGGGSHHSVAIDQRDHIILVDLPNNQARAAAVLAKAKEQIPNKPVRYVITTHHHWDHLGGIREGIAEGATIVTHQSNRQFLQRVARAPHTLSPDRQATAKRPARIQAIGATGRLTDGTRTVELHTMTGLEHAGDMMLVYLPTEKVLVVVDVFTPPAQVNGALAQPAIPFARALYDNVQRLKLDVQTIATLHGNRTTTLAEVARAAGI